MSVPDSHTNIFTRVPDSVTKKWTIKTQDAQTGSVIERANKHEEGPIMCIEVTITFNTDLFNSESVLNENDDVESDKLSAWQEARRSWAKIESALQDAITEQSISRVKAALSNKNRSVDTLSKVLTTYVLPRIRAENDAPETVIANSKKKREPKVYTEPRSKAYSVVSATTARTIGPLDSVSNADSMQMNELLTEIRKTRRAQKFTKSTLGKLARYAANT